MRWNASEYAGWGQVLKARGEVARPERQSQLEDILSDSLCPAIGNRRSYGDAPLNTGGRAIDMTRMDRILAFDPDTGILEAEAGAQIGDIARLFAPKGWLPAVLPGTGYATVGGCIANDVHGKNHHNAGSFGQHVVSLSLRYLGKKKHISAKSSAALFRATLGGLGQTGVILSAKLQLMRCKGDVIMVTERRVETYDEFVAMLDTSDATYSVGWIDATATGAALGRGILEEAETGTGLVPARKKGRSIPFNAPHFALSKPIVKLFNQAYFRRVPDHGRTVIKPITDFFFPLDRILDWNRLYGKSGFHQFQCVVPEDQAPALRTILEKIAGSGLASPLAVIKRMGAGRAGHLSFPMAGYSLAVDFPNRPEAQALIRQLIETTCQAKGRVYLAKDALATGAQVKSMYDEHEQWLQEVAKADPDGAYATDMVRRLNLRNT